MKLCRPVSQSSSSSSSRLDRFEVFRPESVLPVPVPAADDTEARRTNS